MRNKIKWNAIKRVFKSRSKMTLEGHLLRQAMQKSGREDLSLAQGQGAATETSYPTYKVRGGSRDELPHAWGQGSGREKLPHVQGALASWHRRAKRSYSTFKVRSGAGEEIPLVKGKEQWLRFAGAPVKTHSTSNVRETQVRRYVLREGIRGQTDWTIITEN